MTSPSAKLQKIRNTAIASQMKKAAQLQLFHEKMRIMQKMQGSMQ